MSTANRTVAMGSPVVDSQIFQGDVHSQDKAVNSGLPMVMLSKGRVFRRTVAATDSTAGVITYTAAQLIAGLMLRDCNGSGRSDVTPTAALLAAEIGPGVGVGTSFDFVLRNTSSGATSITVTAGTGCTVSGTATVAQNNTKLFRVAFTNVTPGSEAYTIYSVGTFVH